jgi:hypothetical protein
MSLTLQFTVTILASAFVTQWSAAQTNHLDFPKTLRAGTAFSVSTTGSGKAELYIVGLGQVLRRTVNLGDPVAFAASDLHSAGHYVVVMAGPDFTEHAQFDVISAPQPASLSFLAKPARLPVSQPDGISGVVYIFDIFHNLILQPLPVSFELSGSGTAPRKLVATSRNGVAWVRADSPSRAGITQFQATVGGISDKRVVQQFAGDPCRLRMSAQAAGGKILLQTEPVRDCNGNPVSDGTIVTFSESYAGRESTVDVPIKRGLARTEMPAQPGAVIAVASGVVMGNEIHWGGDK